MFAASFGVGQALWSMIWFFLFLMWMMLLLNVFGDLFRDTSLSGIAKAAWIAFVVLTPYLGVLVYLIARGDGMATRQLALIQDREAAVHAYIASAAGSAPSVAAELARLADLRDRGVIDDAELAAVKARLVSSPGPG